LSFQVARAHGVLLDPFKMLSAVQFDDQPAFATVLKSAIYGPIGTCRRNLKPAQRRPLSLFQSACSASVWVRRKVLEQSQVNSEGRFIRAEMIAAIISGYQC
jgi:hypothetical protein